MHVDATSLCFRIKRGSRFAVFSEFSASSESAVQNGEARQGLRACTARAGGSANHDQVMVFVRPQKRLFEHLDKRK